MVGFGSSLRLARRPGWEEGAYLDYETLKLLLSQIEAVYEEEGHSRMSRENSRSDVLWDMELIDEMNNGARRHRNKHRRNGKTAASARDYKDELFLESNSEAAFLSVDEDEFTTSDEDEVSDIQSSSQNNVPQTQPVKPFTLSYSHEQLSSSDEDNGNGCLPTFGSSTKPSRGGNTVGSTSSKMKKRRKGVPLLSTEAEDSFYNVTAGAALNTGTFYLPNNEAVTPTASNVPTSSVDNNTSLQYFPTPSYATEATSLLPTGASGTASPKGSLFSFSSAGGSLTPPTRHAHFPSTKVRSSRSVNKPKTLETLIDSSTPGGSSQMVTNYQPHLHHHQPAVPNVAQTKKKTTRFSRVRRHKQRVIRASRERKVPRHLRLAHAKARAITERFLGLLRAETEKVLLFAQARLGELADTAGSLRFPSFDEEYAANVNSGKRNPSTAGQNNMDYEFGDGGLHPSGSSSSDDGTGFGMGYGRQRWSDSSEEDDASNPLHGKGGSHQMSGMASVTRSKSGASTRVMNMPKSISDEMMSTDQDDAMNSRKDSTARTRDIENIQIVQRQIAQFTEIRKHRAIFQRNDQILGEDMLFLSAVEEADGYTAVGVELMHVLKYICVNLIAVRKICRKHDRLLMNRMLGGYYQRVHRGDASYSGQDHKTLGGLIARVSGDIYEAHPALIGQMKHFKLVGVYDKKIQKLANSRTVQVVSSCLALSLSEYEVARSRADALTRLNSTASLDGSRKHSKKRQYYCIDEDEVNSVEDPPSTASSISLTRLRYTVMSIFALREASRSKINNLMTYLSRMSLSFTGQPVVGEGLDGCSRETLDFLVSYNPDSALLLDSGILFDGLKQNLWSRLPMADVMVSTLAAGAAFEYLKPEVAASIRTAEEKNVAHAVSVLPQSKTFVLKSLKNGQFPHFRDRSSTPIEDIPAAALHLNHMSTLLYTMNYFVTHATTHVFVKAVGDSSPLAAGVLGAPNLSAALISLIHCLLASRASYYAGMCRFSTRSIRWLMIFGSLMAICGNALHATAIDRNSVLMAFAGRLVLGLSFGDILQREVMASCVPSLVVAESGRLILSRVAGIALGLFAGTITAVPLAIERKGLGGIAFSPHSRQLQSANWVMMMFWLIHLVVVLFQVRSQRRTSPQSRSNTNQVVYEGKGTGVGNDLDSDSSSSADIGTPSSVLYRSSSDVTPVGGPMAVLVNGERSEASLSNAGETSPFRRDRGGAVQNQPWNSARQWKTFGRFRKLFSFHVAIPLSLFIFLFCTIAMEAFLTATPSITSQYFDWSGSRAGFYLGGLSLCILPVYFACEIVARRYEERTILRKSLHIVGFGLFAMVNWESLFALMPRVTELFSDTLSRPSHHYDGDVGSWQYVLGFCIVFIGLVSTEGAALSLLSKSSPVHARSILVNVGTLVTFGGLAARLLGDFQIVAVGLSHKLIYTDMVNALVIPLFLTCFLLSHLVNKHFFFLM